VEFLGKAKMVKWIFWMVVSISSGFFKNILELFW
jgi:hypothetical protein